ncbi:non-hydrolyzing UDP-N-acetylglucosamine 2-epimerase [Aegicerativicinus sediminis]
MKLTIVAGARPNFIKIAPLIRAIEKKSKQGININYDLVHTGQHYDKNLSGNFFRELNIPEPDVNLNVGSGTQAEQTAAIMIGFEKYLNNNRPDLVVVVGDVTSTMACAIVAKKADIKLAHVEAGIRSWDLSMPEEINRMVTDCLTDYFFTTSKQANENLKSTGVRDEQIFYVGNVMIDTLRHEESNFKKPEIFDSAHLHEKDYFVLTLHRPNNVDELSHLEFILKTIVHSSKNYKIVFPVHPRTKNQLNDLVNEFDNLLMVEPMGYLEFNYLVKHCKAVITDSGGITEEATVMHVPCITLRENTERPETCEIGTNVLVGSDLAKIQAAFEKLYNNQWPYGAIPELWDGNSAERIIGHLVNLFQA